jgi:hypothetical protein
MKIVISWSGSRVLANAEEAIWCGKPDFEIGVALFDEPHSARRNRGSLRFRKRESQNILTERSLPAHGTPTQKVNHES